MEKKESLSNKVYYDKERNVIVKKYTFDKIKEIYGNNEIRVLELLGYGHTLIEEGVEIEFFEGKELRLDEVNAEIISTIAKEVKQFHSLSKHFGSEVMKFKEVYDYWIDNSKLDNLSEEYLKLEKILLEVSIKELHKGKQVLLHNDLRFANILYSKNGIKLIDFEYSAIGNEIYDIAYFLIANNINLGTELASIWLEQFEGVDYEFLTEIVAVFNSRFARWANIKFKETKNNLYDDLTNFFVSKFLETVKENKLDMKWL